MRIGLPTQTTVRKRMVIITVKMSIRSEEICCMPIAEETVSKFVYRLRWQRSAPLARSARWNATTWPRPDSGDDHFNSPTIVPTWSQN